MNGAMTMTASDNSTTSAIRPRTYGAGRTVRLAGYDYAVDRPVHLTICAFEGSPFAMDWVAEMVCAAVEQASALCGYQLYAYCLMPDHLHLLVSPGDSETAVDVFLRRLKSFTTREYQRRTPAARLWQTSAFDRVLRPSEDVLGVATYIANNPVRRGLVQCWHDWRYVKVLCES